MASLAGPGRMRFLLGLIYGKLLRTLEISLDMRCGMPYHPWRMLEFPPYRLDQRAGRLLRGGQAVSLRPKAWALLSYLAERPGLLVTKEDLHGAVWGDTVVSDDTLTHTLAELRHALRDDARTPRFIETVHRRGVRFIASLRDAQGQGQAVPSDAVSGPVAGEESPILVGRDSEIARLSALLRQASAGQRQVVFIQGEPGIGKSAIVEAFLRTARALPDPVLIGYGQCVEQYAEREPYMPVLEALERLSHGPSRDRLRSALRAVAPSWLARMPSLQRPAAPGRMRRWHVHTTPHQMLREFAGLVEAISTDQPLVLVLEDLHWSDQATVDLFSVLAHRPERARVMLVGTCRPAQAAALHHPIQQVLALLRTRGRCVEIAVEYLSRADVAAYLERRFQGSRVEREVSAAVWAHTDGHPLFMTVLVDHLLARGWLARDGEIWRLTVSRATMERELPDNTRQLIEEQLRFVSPAEREVLEVASVAGVTFDVPAVVAGVGVEADRVESICHDLCGAQSWLRYLGSREWPDGAPASRYAFRHALHQRALYDRLSSSRRATLHERIGRRLEDGYAGRTPEASSELARHFQGGRDQRRALLYLEQAATQAYAQRAYRDVIACLEPALAILGRLTETADRARDELRLRQLFTIALFLTSGHAADQVAENLKRTLELAEQLGDVAARFDVLSAVYLRRVIGGDLAGAEEIGVELSRVTESLDASASLQCSFLRGATALWAGDLSEAKSLLAGALTSPISLAKAERPYGVNPVVAARSFEGLRRWLTGDATEARAMQQEALALAERQSDPFTIAQAATFQAFVLLLDEDWAGGERLATRVIDIGDEFGFLRWRGRGLVIRGRVLVEAGEETRGLAEIRDGLALLRRAGLRLGAPLLFSFSAQACLRLGRLEEGLAATDEGLTHSRDTGARCFEAELWRLRGELLLPRGRLQARPRPGTISEADECFARARAVARAQGARMLERRVRPATGALAAVRGT